MIFAVTLREAHKKNIQTLETIKPIFSNQRLEVLLGVKYYAIKTFYSGLATKQYIDLLSEPDAVKKIRARESFAKDVEKIYSTIGSWHTEEFGTRETGIKYDSSDPIAHQRLYYYEQALKSIYTFVKSMKELTPVKLGSGALAGVDYFLDFPSPTVKGMTMTLIQAFEKTGKPPLPSEYISNGYDFNYFNNRINYAFQKTFQLCKFRGFDLFFRPLQDSDIVDRHHYKLFAFRKMLSGVNDFVLTTQGWHRSDYDVGLLQKLGPAKAEAYVEALIGTMKELDGLRDDTGKLKKISEQDIINALMHNFGAEWKGVFNDILEKNDGDLSESIEKWNSRGETIEKTGYSGFLKVSFGSAYNNLDLVKRIQLAKVLGIVGNKEDFLLFNTMLPGILRIPDNFAKITKYI